MHVKTGPNSVVSNEAGSDAETLFNQGLIHEKGLGVRKNKALAIQLYAKAAEQGHLGAQFNLGLIYEEGRGVAKNEAEAAHYYQQAAAQGHAEAQFNLGLMHEEGRGVAKDMCRAAHYYQQAAEQGHIEAQFDLGLMYQKGRGVANDMLKAVDYYERAAAQGHAKAQFNLGFIFEEGSYWFCANPVYKDTWKAAQYYQQAAEQGHPTAQFRLGFMLEKGVDGDEDLIQAAYYYQQAVEQGHKDARWSLVWLGNGLGVVNEDNASADFYYKQAMELSGERRLASRLCLARAAAKGHANAQFFLGEMYQAGLGTPKKEARAIYHYQQAAEQGHAEAQFILGLRYAIGRGVSEDKAKAFEWLTQAAKQRRYGQAQLSLGLMYEERRDIKEAIELYSIAAENGYPTYFRLMCEYDVDEIEARVKRLYGQPAEQGDIFAQFCLKFMCAEARALVQENRKAVDSYTQAAAQGNAKAQCNLGLMYEEGRGVTRNMAAAAYYYTQAANQGDRDAQYYLALMHKRCRGVAKHEELAFELFRQAAERGDPRAKFHLGLMYQEGRGTSKNEVKAKECLAKVAAHCRQKAQEGVAAAQYFLGHMYRAGDGVPQDTAKAIELFRQAAEQGHRFSQYSLALLYESGLGTPEDRANAFNLFCRAAAQGYAAARCSLGIILFKLVCSNTALQCQRFGGELWESFLRDDYHQITIESGLRLLTQAAKQGNADAQFFLGKVYAGHYGPHVKQDNARAADYYQQAAAQGRTGAAEHAYAQAKFNLALLHADGRGAIKNRAQALAVLREAAQQGSLPARYALICLWLESREARTRADQKLSYFPKELRATRKEAVLLSRGKHGRLYSFGRWLVIVPYVKRELGTDIYSVIGNDPISRLPDFAAHTELSPVFYRYEGVKALSFMDYLARLNEFPLVQAFPIMQWLLAQVVVLITHRRENYIRGIFRADDFLITGNGVKLILALDHNLKADEWVFAMMVFSLVVARKRQDAEQTHLSREAVLAHTQKLVSISPVASAERRVILAALELLQHFLVEKHDERPPIQTARGLTFFSGINWRHLSAPEAHQKVWAKI